MRLVFDGNINNFLVYYTIHNTCTITTIKSICIYVKVTRDVIVIQYMCNLYELRKT